MILAVDIGNTSIHVGLFEGSRLRRRFRVPTALAKSPDRLRRGLARLGGQRLREADEAIVCSVVPRATPAIIRALRAAGCRRVRAVGRDLRVPLRNRYKQPRQVGQDRLVGAYAAWRLYGDGVRRGRPGGRSPERAPVLRFASQREAKRRGESRDCIVVDFGTAITIDIVTKAGEYLGGIIVPGLEISLEALATRTALLPKVELKEPPELLGRDTANSIRSGILYGCAALCDGLVTQLRRRYAPRATVVATGGASPLVAKHARTIDHLKPNLVLDGLYQLSLQDVRNPL